MCFLNLRQVHLGRWRAETQHADEDQGSPIDIHSDDELNVPQRAGVERRDAAIPVNVNEPAREQPSTAPRVRVIDDADDADIWAEIENTQPTPAAAQKQGQANHEPEDFEDWFALDDAPVPPSTSKMTPSVPTEEPLDLGEHGTNALTDDEIGALFAHMDETMSGAAPHPPLPTEDDFEDMYN
jgi:hypothetical protein